MIGSAIAGRATESLRRSTEPSTSSSSARRRRRRPMASSPAPPNRTMPPPIRPHCSASLPARSAAGGDAAVSAGAGIAEAAGADSTGVMGAIAGSLVTRDAVMGAGLLATTGVASRGAGRSVRMRSTGAGVGASSAVVAATGGGAVTGTCCTTGDSGFITGAGAGAIAAGAGASGVITGGATGLATTGGGAAVGAASCARSGVEPSARTAAIAALAGRTVRCVFIAGGERHNRILVVLRRSNFGPAVTTKRQVVSEGQPFIGGLSAKRVQRRDVAR